MLTVVRSGHALAGLLLWALIAGPAWADSGTAQEPQRPSHPQADPPPSSAPVENLDEILVVGHYESRVGTSDSASAGSYTRELIEDRPLLRPGEVEELIPGMIVTQHSGAGKANQYFLRGFNLDHGTDFATMLEGVPVNLPSNAHGQGYMDLNFLIPELVSHADYTKGPYYAQNGDFSSAGAERIYYARDLPSTLLVGTYGAFEYLRALGATSFELLGGKLLTAFEFMHENGPWQVPDNFHKYNGVVSYTHPLAGGSLKLVGMAYSGEWNATNQVTQSAITNGQIPYYGTLNPTDGGSSQRYSLSAGWDGQLGAGHFSANAYAVNYELDLFSDFTFYLVDPVNGDQMEQKERRFFEGTSGSYTLTTPVLGTDVSWDMGWDGRIDEISPLARYHTVDRARIPPSSPDGAPYSLDSVLVANGALYGEASMRPTPWLRAILGLRGTIYDFHDESQTPQNPGGSKTAGLLLPKATVTLGPFGKTEFFANYGEGYHSNDARSLFVDNTKAGAPVTPLPKSMGTEVGVRTEAIPGLQTSLDFWLLDLDSELVWDADNGTNNPSAPTRRKGVEWANSYQPLRWLIVDLNVAYSEAHFTKDDNQNENSTGELSGQPVPQAIRWTVAAGASLHELGPFSASLFLRYFGPRVLCTVGTCTDPGTFNPSNGTAIWSSPSTILNAQVSYQITRNVKITLEGLNLLNARVNDIAYYYKTQVTPQGPAAWNYQVHPSEPFELRGTLTLRI